MVFPLQNNFGSYYHKAYSKFRQGRSNILFLLDIKLWRQYHLVLYLKLLPRIYDISIVFPTSENALQQEKCKENAQYHQNVIFLQILCVKQISEISVFRLQNNNV